MSTPLTNPLARATLYQLAEVELVLVRHGQQIPPEERSDEQRFDPPLSAVGERQVLAVGAHLASEPITAVYSSHLERAHRTGLAIAERHGLEVGIVEDLREVELFTAAPSGVSWADLNRRPDMIQAGEEFVESGRWASFPMSEPGDVFRRRIRAAIAQILAAHERGTVVIACHGGVINGYLAELLGISRDFWFRTAHCSVNRVLVGEGRAAVWNINETHHIPPELATA